MNLMDKDFIDPLIALYSNNIILIMDTVLNNAAVFIK